MHDVNTEPENTLSVRKPILPGTSVRALNYRLKPQAYEFGRVVDTETHWTKDGHYRHSYRVQLSRPSASGTTSGFGSAKRILPTVFRLYILLPN